MKTRKEIEIQTLESLREQMITSATENTIFLRRLKIERLKSGNTDKVDLVAEIRKREANEIQFENDIKLIESELQDKNKKEKKSDN